MVLLGDDLVLSKTPCAKQMLNFYEKVKEPIVAVQRVPIDQTHQYGIVEGEEYSEARTHRITRMVEKPAPGTSESNMAIIGRYILTPEVFKILGKTTPGHGGEIQLTDALLALSKKRPMYAYEFQGTRYDAGDKLGYLKAILAFGVQHAEIGKSLREYIQEIAADF